ncbi:MAG: ATP-binding protein [Lewinellaceae bacterium]|nr:ATP-binding protein [Lewinellaceae bacterium]
MDVEGLTNLWQIGRSNKREEEISKRSERKQIGKFGIGKLATYSVANEITYISKSAGGVYSVSLDYNSLSSSGSGAGRPINLPVLEITNLEKFYESDLIQAILKMHALR